MIPLTMVTSLDNQDTNQTSTYGLDIAQGLLRATAAKPYAIPLPKNAESYRARLELLGTAWCFAKAKNPSKAQLRTISPRLFDAYVKWLFGPRVWGMTTNDEHGNVVATPHIGQVIAFDYQIRKRVADSMNSGVDMEAAFTEAKGDTETRMVHFLNVVSVGINSSECRACTAPDMCDRIKAKPIDTQRAPGKVQPPTTTKGQTAKAKKLRKKARDAELKEAGRAAQQGNGGDRKRKAPLALKNGGVGDGAQKPPKGKGKGKKAKMKDSTDAGESICFNWAKGKQCHTTPCPHKHCCRICEGPHITAECPTPK